MVNNLMYIFTNKVQAGKRFKNMFGILRLLLVLAVVGLSVGCSAQKTGNPAKVFKLKNGHKVVIKEVHANPIVTVDTWVRTGTAMETPEINGVSHFLEHLLFKGTKNYKNGEIEKILESKGARFNASTSKDFTHYYVTIASDYLETAIKLHADMLQNPVIPVEEMEKERKVVQEEIRRANDDPKRILLMNLFGLIFREHPYKMDTLGPHEIIENISREKVMEYYKKRYAPHNLITVVVGDVDTQEALSLVKENFNPAFKPAASPEFINPPREPEPDSPRNITEKGKYKSGYLFMGFKGVPMNSVRDNYALDLAGSILGGSKSSRLYRSLKEDKKLVSAISAGHYSLKDDSVLLVSADFEPENYLAVKTAIMEEIEKFRNEEITEAELDRAKTLAKRSFIYGNESVENIANSIGYSMVTTNTIDHHKNHLQYIENTRLYDVQKAAKTYLDPSRVALSVLLPEQINVNNTVSNKKTIQDSTRSELGNGSVLITSKNTSNDIISMKVFLKGGKFLEPNPGVSAVLRKTLIYGTKNRTYNQIIEELEDSGITISPNASADYFVITLKSTGDDFNKAFEILADIMKNPTFEEKYIEKNKEEILTNIKKSRDRPLRVAVEKFSAQMYKNHPYGNSGVVLEENIPSVTRQDVVDYWSRTFIPENMIFSVAGNIEHDDIVRKLTAAFMSSGKTPLAAEYSDEFTPLDENKIVKTHHDSKAAWILMGWPVGNIKDNKEFAAFKVINNYLSGGLSSKLHITFREQQGLAYTVGSSYTPRMDRGHFVLYIGTEPKNIELVKDKFLKEIGLLKANPLSESQLSDVKNKIIGNYALSQETNQSKAGLLGRFEVVDKEFGFNYDFADLINKVTAEDVINTANKYFSYPYVFSVVAPQEEK